MLLAFATGLLTAALLALAWIDARTGRLPDALSLPLLAAGLALAALRIEPLPTPPLFAAATGAALGYGFLVLLEKAYEQLRGRPGLGRGDAKLLAAGGAWCGIGALPAVLLIASLAALAWTGILYLRGQTFRLTTKLPFGPFLALGILAAWLGRALGRGPLPL